MRHGDVDLQRAYRLLATVATTARGMRQRSRAAALRLTLLFSFARRSSPRAIGDIGDRRRLSSKSEHVQRLDAARGKPLFVCGVGAC
jgi:hypothetical protein